MAQRARPVFAFGLALACASLAHAQKTQMISLNGQGLPSQFTSSQAAISGDGKFVAFVSSGNDIVANDNNQTSDVFLRDVASGVTIRASIGTHGGESNGPSSSATISRDGRYVAFASGATNISDDDINGQVDVFRYDRVTGTSVLVSKNAAGVLGNQASATPSISADGRFVAFVTRSTNLDPLDTDSLLDVYVKDIETGVLYFATAPKAQKGGQFTKKDSRLPRMLGNGFGVVFESDSAVLINGDNNGKTDAFLYTFANDSITLLDATPANKPYPEGARRPAPSENGRYVAFETTAKASGADTNTTSDVYVLDRLSSTLTLASFSNLTSNTLNGAEASLPVMAANGRYVAFLSNGILAAEDHNAVVDLYVRDLVNGDLWVASDAPGDPTGNDAALDSTISDNGARCAFISKASNLVGGDGNGVADCFLFSAAPSTAAADADIAIIPSPDVLVGWKVGNPFPNPVDVTVSNITANVNANLGYAVSMSPSVDWLSIAPTYGIVSPAVGTQKVTLSFNPTNLGPGTHRTVLRFQNVVKPDDYSDLTVTIRIFAGEADMCVSGPDTATGNYKIGGPAPASFSHVISNCGAAGSTVKWQVFKSPDVQWLQLNQQKGTLKAGEQIAIQSIFNPAGLPNGSYSTQLIFRNLDKPSDKFLCKVDFKVGDLIPALCVDDVNPIGTTFQVGTGTAQIFQRFVTNCGPSGSKLFYGVKVLPSVGWLSAGPNGGPLDAGQVAQLDIRVKPQGLAAGSYSATVYIENLNDPGDVKTIPVTVQVSLPPADLCIDSTAAIAKTFVIGGDAVSSDSRVITNCGPNGSQLSYSIETVPSAPWLIPNPSPIVLPAGGSQTIGLAYNVAGLAPGTYNTNLRFVNTLDVTDVEIVPVTVTIGTAKAKLCLDNATAMIVPYTIGGAAPGSFTKGISNCGDANSTLSLSVFAQPGVNWLEIVTPTASLAAGQSVNELIKFHPEGLAAGIYETTVRFVNVNDATNFVDVLARLEINQPAADLNATPGNAISVDYTVGGANPNTSIVNVQNVGVAASSLSWAAEINPLVSWLAVVPSSGTLSGGQSKSVGIQFNPTGLAAGTFNATVRFVNQANAADFVAIPVTLNVKVAKADLTLVGASDVTLNYKLGDATPAPLSVTVKNVGDPLSKLPVAVMTSPTVGWLDPNPDGAQLDGTGPNSQTNVLGIYSLASLTPGSFTTKLTFVNLSDPTDRAEINVTVNVTSPPADLCSDNSAAVTASWTQGDVAPATVFRSVKNCGTAPSSLGYSTTVSPAAPWLIVGPQSGTVAGGNSQSIGFSFTPSGLGVGQYTTTVTFKNNADATDVLSIPVTLDVLKANADLALASSAPIATSFTQGGALPSDVILIVKNIGHPVSQLGFTATEIPAVDWLDVSPSGGQIVGNTETPATIHFTPTAATPSGALNTVIRFANIADAADFVDVAVTFTVSEPASDLDVLGGAISAHYDIGFDPPAGANFTVKNLGPIGSTLDWAVEVLPASPWLSLAGGITTLDSGATTDVALSFLVAGLAEGNYDAVVRFKNLENAADFVDFAVSLEVAEPKADLCIVDDLPSIQMSFVVGQAPSSATFEIANCGSELADLDWTIQVDPPVAWLTVTPPTGTLLASQESAPVTLGLVTSGLIDGIYETQLKVQNVADPTDFVLLPVTLDVGNQGFLVGDRILGGFAAFDTSHELEFDALKKEVVKFNAVSPSKGKVQVSVIDAGGKVVKSLVMKVGAKPVKKAIKIKATGHYRLRIEPAKSTLPPFDIKTKYKLPKSAKLVKKSGSGPNTLQALAPMLPGGFISGKVKKSGTDFPLAVSLAEPSGLSFDITAFSTALTNGLQLNSIPASSLGSWTVTASGMPNKKSKVKVNLKLVQPKGISTIVLPGAPAPGP